MNIHTGQRPKSRVGSMTRGLPQVLGSVRAADSAAETANAGEVHSLSRKAGAEVHNSEPRVDVVATEAPPDSQNLREVVKALHETLNEIETSVDLRNPNSVQHARTTVEELIADWRAENLPPEHLKAAIGLQWKMTERCIGHIIHRCQKPSVQSIEVLGNAEEQLKSLIVNKNTVGLSRTDLEQVRNLRRAVQNRIKRYQAKLGTLHVDIDSDRVKPTTMPDAARREDFQTLPRVAIVGSPNVGKSTIANRLMRGVDDCFCPSIEYDEEGITRDRTYGESMWNGRRFIVIDTGGLTFKDQDGDLNFQADINRQVMIAIEEATVVVLVVDGSRGCTNLDMNFAKFLRRLTVPVLLAVNKCDSVKREFNYLHDFWNLGLGEPRPVSGAHGSGVGDLLDDLVKTLPSEAPTNDLRALDGKELKDRMRALGEKVSGRKEDFIKILEEHAATREDTRQESSSANASVREIRVALLGRPNVGKSSLLNKLIGENRAIVSNISGTTRDTIVARVLHKGTNFVFIDTAGVRRKTKVIRGVEEEMMKSSARAINRADVCLLVLNAKEGTAKEDAILARMIALRRRACLIVNNMWDLVENRNREMKQSKRHLQTRFGEEILGWGEPLYISAKTGQRVDRIFDAVNAVASKYHNRIIDEQKGEDGAEDHRRRRYLHSSDRLAYMSNLDDRLGQNEAGERIHFRGNVQERGPRQPYLTETPETPRED